MNINLRKKKITNKTAVKKKVITKVPQPKPRLKKKVLKDPEQFTRSYILKPVFKNGSQDQIEGLVFSYIANDSPFKKVGLQVGDKIISVNAKPLATIDRAVNLLNEFANSDQILITFERDTETKNIIFKPEKCE